MEELMNYVWFETDLVLEGEKRIVEVMWVKVNPACRVMPDVPLDFYIIRTKDEEGNWILV